MDFAVSTDHRVEVKESEKRNEYLYLARELKIENDHNAEKSPGDLRRLAVTETPVKNHQLMM